MLQRFQLRRTDKWLPVLFFLVLLFVGIDIYQDYGISWDEPLQHQVGLATWDYIFGKNDDLLRNDNSYLNPFIAGLEAAPEKIFNLKANAKFTCPDTCLILFSAGLA